MVRTMGPTAARPNWCMSADSVPFAGGTLAANGTLMKIQMLKEFSTNGTAFKVKDMATELQAELSKPFLAYPFVTEIRVRATVDLDWFRSSTGPKAWGDRRDHHLPTSRSSSSSARAENKNHGKDAEHLKMDGETE